MLRDLFCLFPACAGVILRSLQQIWAAQAFPRMRGGDPLRFIFVLLTDALFPACAGVIPPKEAAHRCGSTFPRMRGGDPHPHRRRNVRLFFSPHARG